MLVDGKECLSFCSNDYLGLANHSQIIRAFKEGVEKYSVGSGASHLVNGHSEAHHELELALAEFVQRPRALLFSTGYMANLGVMSALLNTASTSRHDAVFSDRLNHASLLDAAQLSGARLHRYQHNDTESLISFLKKSPATHKLVATDSVFSMDGDMAPLPELAKIALQRNAWLMVDDAHGFGVLGDQGRGSLSHFGLKINDAPILMCTLGKAIGTFGAFVAGSEALIETLIQQARSYIYTTALPPAIAVASLASLKLVQQDDWRREKLAELVTRFKDGAAQLGLNLMPSDTAIQPLLVGDNNSAMQLSEALLNDGIHIVAIRPPTVPVGSARLRITFSACHTEQHIDRLLDALSQHIRAPATPA